jgi:uncharacterized protein YndB with AHSA1/START domain
MADPRSSAAGTIALVVRRVIRATPERLFEAWTEPTQLRSWWGPEGVTCERAEIDLRVGGRYRIENGLPDGRTIVLVGEFEVIERPNRLTYTWHVDGSPGASERVTVRFERRDRATEVIITHERILDESVRDQHRRGWEGCLDGLARHVLSS